MSINVGAIWHYISTRTTPILDRSVKQMVIHSVNGNVSANRPELISLWNNRS